MNKLFILLLFLPFGLVAQTPEAGELFGLRSVTTTEMNLVASPTEGTLIYNTDEKAMFYYNGSTWKRTSSPSTIILDRDGGNGLLPTATNTYFDLPLNASNVQVNQGTAFTVVGASEIRINETGIYQLSASLSSTNLPSGGTKFILGARRNGGLIGYLSRGFVTLPSQDFWGTSGTLVYSLTGGDVINIQYVLNAGGANLNVAFANIAITKL